MTLLRGYGSARSLARCDCADLANPVGFKRSAAKAITEIVHGACVMRFVMISLQTHPVRRAKNVAC
jgi:hypothetical protein